jgi:tRNA(Ile)-lysidine synthase
VLGWKRVELEQVCAGAGLSPVADPSNTDERYERVRIRRALGEADWLDRCAIARAAAHLADADTALDWAARLEWDRAVDDRRGTFSYSPTSAPPEILRRIVTRAVRRLATEGEAELRGPELDRLLATLGQGGTATLRGVLCEGGSKWRFSPASPRRG